MTVTEQARSYGRVGQFSTEKQGAYTPARASTPGNRSGSEVMLKLAIAVERIALSSARNDIERSYSTARIADLESQLEVRA